MVFDTRQCPNDGFEADALLDMGKTEMYVISY
jgi:hypothetical protein